MNDIEQITQELTWKLRQKELYPNLPIEAIKLPEDDNGTHLGLFFKNKLVTVVSLFEVDGQIQFRKLATDSRHQHKGFGRKMIRYVTKFASQKGFPKIWCNARKSAVGFYEKIGFITVGEFFEKNDIEYIVMEFKV